MLDSQNELYQGPIIDCHMHFWDLDKNLHPWLNGGLELQFRYGNYDSIKKNFLPHDYRKLTVNHNIVGTVYMEAEWSPHDPIGETKYISELYSKENLPNSIVAQAWLDHPEASYILRQQVQSPLVKSVRHKPGGYHKPKELGKVQQTLMSNNVWRQGYRELSKYGLHFDLQTPWWNLWEAKILAQDFPDTIIIINHSGLPLDRSIEALNAWQQEMTNIAECQNVIVKISGLGQQNLPWSAASNKWIIQEIIKIFGVERTMFASNFPVDSLCGSFDDIYFGFKEITSIYSYCDNRSMYHDNAIKYYQPHLKYK